MNTVTNETDLGTTSGWVGIAISESSKMSPSDPIVGWVSDYDGSIGLLDCWSGDYNQVSTSE